MVRLRLISRRTKYNYLQVLEKLGIGKNTISDQDFDLIEEKDFNRYYQIITSLSMKIINPE